MNELAQALTKGLFVKTETTVSVERLAVLDSVDYKLVQKTPGTLIKMYQKNSEDEEYPQEPIVKYEPRDAELALRDISTMPWEVDTYGVSLGYMHGGHCLVCEGCAKGLHLNDWGSIEAVDVTHTPRHECDESCGEWVGEQCANEDCHEYAQDDHGLCDDCINEEFEDSSEDSSESSEDVGWPKY